MWGTAPPFASGTSPRPSGLAGRGPGGGESASFVLPSSASSYPGVLSPDLPRPISVRDLGQPRGPAVPPSSAPLHGGSGSGAGRLFGSGASAAAAPPPSLYAPPFSSFAVPSASAVYAATSGVATSQPLSTRAEVSDLGSLARRSIDHLSSDELYNYASHLQDASKQFGGHLAEAYAKRDQYRSEVAHLKHELHGTYVQVDLLRREQEQAREALHRLREDNTQLRQQLATTEGNARNVQAKLAVLSGADPSVAVHYYQAQLTLKEAQLRELQQECERANAAATAAEAAAQRRSNSLVGAAGEAPGVAVPSEVGGAAAAALREAEAAAAALQKAVGELESRNEALIRELAAEKAAHAADRAELAESVAQLRGRCAEMQGAEDELVAALSQRAPVSKKDFEALQNAHSTTSANLAAAETLSASLREAKEGAEAELAALHRAYAAKTEATQALQAREAQLRSLAENLQRELDLAAHANALRQEQLEVTLESNRQMAERMEAGQGALQDSTEAQRDLRAEEADVAPQLEELHARVQEAEHSAAAPVTAEASPPAPSQEREVRVAAAAAVFVPRTENEQAEYAAVEAELATLRDQRDGALRERDQLVDEVRHLHEARVAAGAAGTLEQQRARDDDSNGTALEEARQCIEQLQSALTGAQTERNVLEAKLAEVARVLADSEAAARAAASAAAAEQHHLEDVVRALKDELAATQAQERLLRASEEAQRERCGAQQRTADQLQARVAELEAVASAPSTQPAAADAAAKDAELCTMTAALASLADQLDAAEQRRDALAAEHARTVEELTAAVRATAELEARVAAAEGRQAAVCAAAEGASDEQAGRVAALAAEVASLKAANASLQSDCAALKAKLSASREAVSTFALSQTDGELSAASLQQRFAVEAQGRAAAEAQAAELRAARDAAQAELAVALQRGADVQATLAATADQLAEQEAAVEQLHAQNVQLKVELSAEQGLAMSAKEARDALSAEEQALRGLLADAEQRVGELRTALAKRESELAAATSALDSAAAQLCEVTDRLQSSEAAASRATAAQAQASDELTAARSALAAAETQAAETRATADALAAEVASLKVKLAACSGAIAALAESESDKESSIASLHERLSTEAQRRTAAEATIAELRAARDTTEAELTEVLQRSADLQATLTRTTDRLTEQEALVEQLNRDAAELDAKCAASVAEVAQLQAALADARTDKADVVAQLVATQQEVDRAAEAEDGHIREEERLRDALSITTSAFEVQTKQVRLGMAHMADVSRAFCTVLEMASADAGRRTESDHAPAPAAAEASSMAASLAPWAEALAWVTAMEKRLDALDALSHGARVHAYAGDADEEEQEEGPADGSEARRTSRSSSSASSSARRSQHRRAAAAPRPPSRASSAAASAELAPVTDSFLCRTSTPARAAAALTQLAEAHHTSANVVRGLRDELETLRAELRTAQAAVDALAAETTAERERADSLSAAIDDATEKIVSAQAEFDEQLRQRTAATTAEVIEARRAEARAAAAQRRAEEQLAAVEADLKEVQASLHTAREENHRLTREADRLMRSSRLLEQPGSRGRSEAAPTAAAAAAAAALAATSNASASAAAVEAMEQAQLLQVSSLQADLLLSRRQARDLESREALLRHTCATLEEEVRALRLKAADAEELREELATLRADYADLEERYNEVVRMNTTAAAGATVQELRQLRQQLKVRNAELEEANQRLRDAILSKATPELEAARRQAALRESLSSITTQLTATQAQYGAGSHAGSRRSSFAGALGHADPSAAAVSSSPSSQEVWSQRMEHLQALVRERDAALEKVQAAQLEALSRADALGDQLAAKSAALDRAEGLNNEYAETIVALTTAGGGGGAAMTSTRGTRATPSVPPLTPLTPRTREEAGATILSGDAHSTAKGATAVAAASPAPRMPNLDEVADEEAPRSNGARRSTTSPASSTRASSARQQRGSRNGSTTHRPATRASATATASRKRARSGTASSA